MEGLFSHVDLRVRDGARALVFYDVLLAEFGFSRVRELPFTEAEPVWRRTRWEANDESFGFVVDSEFSPNQNRIAFRSPTREHVDLVTAALRDVQAREIDGPPIMAATMQRFSKIQTVIDWRCAS